MSGKKVTGKKSAGATIVALPLIEIVVSSTNPRKHFDKGAMKELTESIRQQGVISPILVRPITSDKYEIVAGERRYRAALDAKLKEIPAIVREMDDNTALEIQVIENLHRTDLHPLEEAEGYEALIHKHGYKTVDDIAAKVGKSKSYVYGRMKLCDLVPECRKMMYEDKLTPSTALLVARIPKELQKDAASEICGDQWVPPMSYRSAADHIKENFMLSLDKASFDTAVNELIPKVCSCISCQKRTGNQPDLFGDIKSADVCTDPACFKIKVKRGAELKIQEAEKTGKVVLPQKEAEKCFQQYHGGESHLVYNAPFINLADTCYETPKSSKYKDIVKKTKSEDNVVLAVAPDGSLFELYPKKKMADLLKAYGVKKTATASSSEADSKRRQEHRLKQKALPIIMDQIMAAMIEKRADKLGWRLFAEQLLVQTSFDVQRIICKRRFPEIKAHHDDVFKSLEKALKETPDDMLSAFCFELVITSPIYSFSSDFGVAMTKAAKLFEVDIKAIMKDLKDKTGGKKNEQKKAGAKKNKKSDPEGEE